MSEQLSERGKDLVKYMPQAVNALADRLIEKLEERLLYGEKPLTNYDILIRQTPEELAKLLAIIPNCGKPTTYTIGGFCIDDGVRTEKEWLKWLKQEVLE